MKNSLKKLREFALIKNDVKKKRDHQHSAQLDELAQASQDMQDMRNCYDSLLSAAAAAANSAHEFSESLREMGACLLEKTALNDDEESGQVLLMLGKVQFELQNLIDSYRLHIFQTITTPSESLLNELRTVEEMKQQCDEKRNVYEYMLAAQREKGRSRSTKGESFSSRQLQIAHDEYDEEATLFVFRLKSLKQGQFRSILTQAARHHAAQLNFFKKGLHSLETVEQHVKLVTEQQRIDYQFSGLEDDDEDDDDANEDGELSFDYGQNDHGQEVVSTSRKSMELDQGYLSFPQVSTTEVAEENLDKSQGNLHSSSLEPRQGSQSAPIFSENKFDPAERIRQMRPSPTQKFHTYVLPTPVDLKSSIPLGSSNSTRYSSLIVGHTRNLWYSSLVEPKMHHKASRDDKLSGGTILKADEDAVLKESNVNSASIRLPPPLTEGLSFPQLDLRTGSDTKKIKRQAFSGPLTGKPGSSKVVHGMLSHAQITHSSSPPNVSPSASPLLSGLHELPRPPVGLDTKSARPTGLIGHSAPLISQSREPSGTNKTTLLASNLASPLPTPPLPRSFSIPSSGQRTMTVHVAKLTVAPKNR